MTLETIRVRIAKYLLWAALWVAPPYLAAVMRTAFREVLLVAIDTMQEARKKPE